MNGNIRHNNEIELYGKDAVEKYVFSIIDGSIDSISVLVKIDNSGNGVASDEVTQKDDIPIGDVPDHVLEQLEITFVNGMEQLNEA